MSATTSDTEVERLQKAWPNWHVRNRGSLWLATRPGPPLTRQDIKAGLYATLCTESADQLAELLAEQSAMRPVLPAGDGR